MKLIDSLPDRSIVRRSDLPSSSPLRSRKFLFIVRLMRFSNWIAFVATVVIFSSSILHSVAADEPTAFSLIQEGNKHVGEEAKNRVVELRSEKSIGSLVPNVWYVVYFDPDATAKATEVKFGSGKKLSVKRPARILEFVTGNKEMDRGKLKIDSDKAISIASKEPMLGRLTLSSTQLWLQSRDGVPTWKVRLWAVKLRNPSETADIGELLITADEGKVVKNDLHIDRVD
jgi:hypothetical protein